MITNGHGLPLAIELTDGEALDYKGFDLVFAGRALPNVLIADRGYDVDRIRDAAKASSGTGVIPIRQGRKNPVPIDSFAYALRNRLEEAFGKLKNARRMATGYDQAAASYLDFFHTATMRLWVHYFVNAD